MLTVIEIYVYLLFITGLYINECLIVCLPMKSQAFMVLITIKCIWEYFN